jgi:hypothetical protein
MKNKNNSSSNQKKDNFDVKENLRKLRSGTGKGNNLTESDLFKGKTYNKNNSYIYQDESLINSMTSSADKFETIKDKFGSEISNLKDTIYNQKLNTNEKIYEKVDKSEFRWWIGGAVGSIIFIGSIIYTFSYQEILTDTKNLKEKQYEFNRNFDKVNTRLDLLENGIENHNHLNQTINKTDTTKLK